MIKAVYTELKGYAVLIIRKYSKQVQVLVTITPFLWSYPLFPKFWFLSVGT